ncbi:MAG: HAMP domain-containing histidine kinase [Clostridiaceae bacterium]|nr:HAMP domain-containing histidine kinase [Clostridiaceae bacterium]
MTIKKKILLSNITMLLLLLTLVLVITFYIIRVFINDYDTYEIESVKFRSDDSISVYELQSVFNNLMKMTKETDGNIKKSKYFSIVSELLDKSGTLVEIKVDNVTTYRTEGYDNDDIYRIACNLTAADVNDHTAVMYSDTSSFVYRTDLALDDGKVAEILLVNEKVGTRELLKDNDKFQADRIRRLKDSILSISFIGTIIIIILNMIIVAMVSNSITKSLYKLKDGARMIAEGNLDFEIEDDSNDEVTEVIQTFDFMRRKLYESTMNQRRQEEHKKEMIAGISHDLRTPLTSIKGYVAGLIDGIADSPEKQQQYLTTIYNTAEEMGNLVDELFLFSKLDLDRVAFNFEKTDIVEYLSFCCDDLMFSLEKRNVVLTFTNLIKGKVYVDIDKNQFSRVLLNIADNTAKYKVNEIGRLDISVEKEDDIVRIELKDDGVGVPAHDTEKIFDSFYRNDPARTNPVSGSGLGLAIARQIIEAHNGKIYARSNVGEGLTIIIELKIIDNGNKEGIE